MWNLGAKVWDRSPPPVEPETHATTTLTEDPEKRASPPHSQDQHGSYETDHESIDKDLQDGVHRVEAVTSVWSYKTLIVVYAL